MPVSIVSNLSSQFAQSAIQLRSQNVIDGTQRLASGKRVFTASEDAASTAVASGLRIENAALSKAQINAAGAVSMLQIADGSLAQVGDIAIRMKALAIQASTGNYGPDERAALDLEFQALKSEIGRIAADTEFNGVKMLAGKPAFDLQGAHDYTADGVVGLSFEQNVLSSDAVFRYSYDSTTEQMTLSRVDGGVASSQTIDLTGLLDNVAGTAQNLASGETLPLYFTALGVTLTLGTAFDRTADILPTVTDTSGADISLTTPTFAPAATSLSLEGVAALQALGAPYVATSGDIVFDTLTDGAAVTLGGVAGLRYAVNGGAVGADGADSADLVGGASYVDVYITTASGTELLGRLDVGAVATTGPTDGTVTVPLGQGIIGADYTGLTGDTLLTYKVGSGIVAGQDLITVNVAAVTVAALGLDTTVITDQFSADGAITQMTSVLTQINQVRAQLGAQQARLEYVGRNIATVNENNEGARSALIDVDVPAAITELTNDQAMMEVGVSMLGQANRLPQILLDLLRQG
ncbi:MAG: hypothetical protein H6922_02785 [Pseudomonadaceae bacterium]|nr:hypothetical protein [Pseudomonadaceae bacterium]